MILKEFFNHQAISKKDTKSENKVKDDDLFFYILDHDRLHKDYFFEIAEKIQNLDDCGEEQILELYMPMVNRGCKEYYSDKKMYGKLGKLFPSELREKLCHRLHDHYYEDIKANKYKLG